MPDEKKVCSGGNKLILACSGAADVGAVADLSARKMTREGTGKMFCLAGVGGRIEPIMKTTQSAEKMLAIDGCPLNCVKACLEQVGLKNFLHLQLADIGLIKGQSAPSEDNINKVAAKAAEMLQD